MSYLLVLICGLLYEAGCVFWVYAAEQRKPVKIALWAMLCASVQLTGLIESVRDLKHVPFFILGYGLGAGGAVLLKKRLDVQ
jgi:hypothetical protein